MVLQYSKSPVERDRDSIRWRNVNTAGLLYGPGFRYWGLRGGRWGGGRGRGGFRRFDFYNILHGVRVDIEAIVKSLNKFI